MSDLDNWFWGLLQPLRTSARSAHPSRTILCAYVKGQLPDTWRVPTPSLDLNDWTLTEVSQHVLVCRDCAQQLADLRQRELGHVTVRRDVWHHFPSAIRAHLTAYALALLVLFALNAFFVIELPPPMVLLPCTGPGALKEPAQPAAPESAEINWRFEGLNRPVSLSCAPVPAPRPWWQTWWIGWVFIVWTILLGLHILWDWLVSTTPQRPTPASAALRSVGFVSVFV